MSVRSSKMMVLNNENFIILENIKYEPKGIRKIFPF